MYAYTKRSAVVQKIQQNAIYICTKCHYLMRFLSFPSSGCGGGGEADADSLATGLKYETELESLT
jgi:hypothetical protein